MNKSQFIELINTPIIITLTTTLPSRKSRKGFSCFFFCQNQNEEPMQEPTQTAAKTAAAPKPQTEIVFKTAFHFFRIVVKLKIGFIGLNQHMPANTHG